MYKNLGNQKGVTHILLVILLLIGAGFLIYTLRQSPILISKKVAVSSSVPSSSPVSTISPNPKNTLVNIFNFVHPEPPANHARVAILQHEILPSLKYLSTPDAIPNDWVTYDAKAFTFKYPSIYKIVERPNQSLAFYFKSVDTTQIQACTQAYGTLLHTECKTPVFVMYYARFKQGSVGKGDSYYLGTLYSAAVLYALDSREWLVSTPSYPVEETTILGETATKENIIELAFQKYDDALFTTDEGTNGFNYRDEMYRIISTVEITDENKAQEVRFSHGVPHSAYKITGTIGTQMSADLLRAAGLDYLAKENMKLELKHLPSVGESTVNVFYTTYPKGYIRTGSYQYKDAKFEISEESDSLVSFLHNRKYCVQDSDCALYDGMCQTGFYNKYQNYSYVLSCMSQKFEETDTYLGMDWEKDCSEKVRYDSISCVQNKCQGNNIRFTCE